jgi:hypothetical protein
LRLHASPCLPQTGELVLESFEQVVREVLKLNPPPANAHLTAAAPAKKKKGKCTIL